MALADLLARGQGGADDEPGNVDLDKRPIVTNPAGGYSTVRSASFNVDGKETLIPTVSDDGKLLSDKAALALYKRTGKHLGRFASVEAADAFAQKLHEDEAKALPSFLEKKPRASLSDLLSRAAVEPAETRPVRNTGPDLAGQLKGEAAAAAPPPGVTDALVAGARKGASFGFGDEIEAGVQTLAGSAPASMDTYRKARDAIRSRDKTITDAHPIAAGVGETVTGLATSLIPGVAPARAATAGQVAMQAAKVGGVAGAGNSEADLTKGDVGGLARDVGVSAAANAAIAGGISRFVRNAPERVDDRLVANISRGEAGGAAKDKLYKKLVAKAGDEFEGLNDTLSRYPGAKRMLSTSASTSPEKGAKLTTRVIDQLDHRITPIFKAIDEGPAVPKAADLRGRLAGLWADLKEAGNTGMADVVENFDKHLAKHYLEGDAVPAAALRKLKQEVGEIAFTNSGSIDVPFRERAKRAIYGAINQTIEDAAEKTPGVSVEQLRQLNKDTSMFIAVRDTLADRSAKAKAGRTSLFQNLLGAGAIVAGGSAGGLEGAAAGAALVGAKRALAPAYKLADYQLAKLVQAARAGSTKAQIGQVAIEMGLSRAAAEEVSARISRGEPSGQ